MIRLYRPIKSSTCTYEELKNAAFAMSNNKCAYCEASFNIRGVKGTIDHFQCQSKHPDKVKEWTNLLPSCQNCNESKAIHQLEHRCPLRKNKHAKCNVMHIINPTTTDPKNELYYQSSFFYARTTPKGVATIKELDLNRLRDEQKFGKPKTYTDISSAVDGIITAITAKVPLFERTLDYVLRSNFKYEVTRLVKDLLDRTSPQKEFSAVNASEIYQNKHYPEMLTLLKSSYVLNTLKLNLLTEINQLEQQVQNVAFDPPPRSLKSRINYT